MRALSKSLECIPDSEIVVVDNDSQDGSVEKLSLATHNLNPSPVRVTILGAERNGGFAYGVNQGVAYARSKGENPEYVYLLNSDAFPERNAVGRLVRFLEENPGAGIAGSYVHGVDGEPHQTAFRFPTHMSELEQALRLGIASKLLERWRVPMPMPEGDCQVDWVAGASMLIRRNVFDDVGPFDERFFLYFEETDFCRRAAQHGWSTHYVRESRVVHIGAASTGLKKKGRRMPQYWFDSRQHYFRKNHGPTYLTLSDLLFTVGFSLWRVRRRLQNKPDLDPPALLGDFVRHSVQSRLAPPPVG